MDKDPKILVIAEEPMLMVDMLSELEGRGFSVEPMKPDEQSNNCLHPGAVDAAVFDFHHLKQSSLRFASELRRLSVPVVALGDDHSSDLVRQAGIENCLPMPVDYDRLSELLLALVRFSAPAHDETGGHAGSPA
jgi:DNA-binding response OmpR family regulator